MRKFWLGIIGLAAASTANAAVVTYTLSLHESATGAVTTQNQFVIYASVSQGDNAGLFAYGVDIKGTGDVGGPTTMTLVNRTPSGKWDADQLDPNYDPGNVYPSKFGGYGAGRAATASTGIISGVTDLSKGDPSNATPGDLVRVFGIGQVAHKMDESRPPADQSTGVPVAYGPYVADAGTDGGATAFGNPSNPAGATYIVPAGAIRIATGNWTGTAPSIENLSVNTKASVWKLNELNNPKATQNDIALLDFKFRDLGGPPPGLDTVSLNGTLKGTNQAVAGGIAVTGSNGKYSSEVDQLLDPSVATGNAPIQTIGDEAGNVYVMAKLVGSAADIATVLANLTNDVDATDPEFAKLHTNYDGAFGAGGFNALLKFTNVAGAKTFNWELAGTHGSVVVDQLAAVPEPASLGLLGVAGLALAGRRRRKA